MINNSSPLISVIIPSKNGKKHLKDCLPTVLAAAARAATGIEIIVVDDNSKDASPAYLKNAFKDVKVLSNPRRGACSARNHGVLHSVGKYLCFLDNDVFLEEDFFNTLIPYLTEGVFCVACAGYKAYPATGEEEQLDGVKLISWKRGFFRFTGNIYNKDLKNATAENIQSFGVQGAYFACTREHFDLLGGFDELFDPYMLEETDFMYRGLKRGWRVTYAPNTKPRHKCGGTINSKHNPHSKFLAKRNRELFVLKNVTDRALLITHILWLFKSLPAMPYILKNLKEILKKRKAQHQQATKTDTQVLAECRAFQRAAQVKAK